MLLPAMAMAQQPVTEKKAPAADPYADLPDEFIYEAQAFYMECQNSWLMRSYHNCKCMAGKYLDTRMTMGPQAHKSTIANAIDGECADATEAAGIEYNGCLKNSSVLPADIPIEDYCTCYASTYTKLYEKTKSKPGSETFINLKTQAHLTCQDPNYAKKFYPIRRQN